MKDRIDLALELPRMWSKGQILGVMSTLVAVAAWLRLFNLGDHDLRGDEAFSIAFAQNDWGSILDQLRGGEPHQPLYYLALNVWIGLAGQSEFAARWPSAAAGILLVPLVFAFWRRLNAPATGVIVGGLVSANPYLIWHSQDARMYTMATAFSAAALYWALATAGIGRPPRARDARALAAATLLALYTHYVAVAFVAAVNAAVALRWLLFRGVGAVAVRQWSLSLVVVAVIYLPWFAAVLPVMGSYGGNAESPSLAAATTQVLTTLAAGELSPEPYAGMLAGAIAAVAAAGATTTMRREPMAGILAIGSLTVPFLALFLAGQGRPVFNPRYLVLASPGLYLLAARGLALGIPRWQLGKLRSIIIWPTIGVIGVVIAILTGFALQAYYFDRPGRGDWSAFAGHIARSASADDLVIFNYLDPSFSYYYRRLGGVAPAVVQPSRPDATAEQLDREIGELISPGRIVWFVPDDARAWDKQGLVAVWLDRRAVRRDVVDVAAKEVVQYRVPAGVRQDLAYSDTIRLEGFELRDGKSEFVSGETAKIDLLWRALAPVKAAYSISLQMLDDGGRLVTQADGPPAGGKAPTTTWRETELIVDTRSLRMPERPGAYTLAVAMYEWPSLKRLPVAGAPTDLATLQAIHVLP